MGGDFAALGLGLVHDTEHLLQQGLQMLAVFAAVFCDGLDEQVFFKAAGVFSKQAKQQPRQELVEGMVLVLAGPIGIDAQNFVVKPGHAAGGFDIDLSFLTAGVAFNSRQWQEKSKMLVELVKVAMANLVEFFVEQRELPAIGGND